MNCPETPEKLSHYIDGDVTEAERLEVERHISECVACAQYVEAFRDVGRRLADEPRIQMPDDAVARLAAVVDSNLYARKESGSSVSSKTAVRPSESWWRRLFSPATGAAVASVAVVAMAVVVWSSGTEVMDSSSLEPSLERQAPLEQKKESSGARTKAAEDEDAAAESGADGYRSQLQVVDEDGLRELAEGTEFIDVLVQKGKILSGKPNAPEGAADTQLFDTAPEISADEAIAIVAGEREVEMILTTRALFRDQEVWVVVLAPVDNPDAQFAAAVAQNGTVLYRTD